MNFQPGGNIQELIKYYRRFIQITGWSIWEKRISTLRLHSKENPFIRNHLIEKYSLELEMDDLHKRIQRGNRVKFPASYETYALYSFISSISSLYIRLSDKGKKRLSGMIRDCLSREHGLTPLQHEINIATYFMSQGFDVSFSDLEIGSGFDFLVEKDGVEIEIECKTHSADLGRKIHKRKLFDFGGKAAIHFDLGKANDSVAHIFNIVIPDRFENSEPFIKKLLSAMEEAINNSNHQVHQDGFSISYYKDSIFNTPFVERNRANIKESTISEYINSITPSEEDNLIAAINPSSSAFIISVKSEKEDDIHSAFINQLKRSRKGQISGHRPAMIFVRLSDLYEWNLWHLYQIEKNEKITGLSSIAYTLFSRDDWDIVHTLGFMTKGHLSQESSGYGSVLTSYVYESSSPYLFKNKNCVLKESVDGVFD